MLKDCVSWSKHCTSLVHQHPFFFFKSVIILAICMLLLVLVSGDGV